MKAVFRYVPAVALLAISAAAAAQGFRQVPEIDAFLRADTTEGASVIQSADDPRIFEFSIPDAPKARAELRRASVSGALETMGGIFMLRDAAGDRLSIIQALNVTEPGKPTGPSEPVAQLAIRKTGKVIDWKGNRRAEYAFYIEQAEGKPLCERMGTFAVGEPVVLAMQYRPGRHPVFIRDGDIAKICTGGKSNRLMGNPSGGGAGPFHFYGKLGVYKTSSGTGSARAVWADIFD